MIHFKSCKWKNFLSTGNDPIEIKERVKKAEIEMKTEADFDTVIINEELDVAKQELIDKVEKFLK